MRSTIASRLSIASGFSSFAITGTRRPTRSITAWTSSMSAADRTNDSAMRSTPRRSANSRSAMSLSDRAGTDTFIPGSDTPLLLLTGPPSVTRHTTSLPSTSVTTSPILPSSTSNRSPGVASSASCFVGGRHPIVGALALVDGDPHDRRRRPTRCRLRRNVPIGSSAPGGRRGCPPPGRCVRTRRAPGDSSPRGRNVRRG